MSSNDTHHESGIRKWIKTVSGEYHAVPEWDPRCYETVCGLEIYSERVVWAMSDREAIRQAGEETCPSCDRAVHAGKERGGDE